MGKLTKLRNLNASAVLFKARGDGYYELQSTTCVYGILLISHHLSCLAFILTPSLQFATYNFPKGYMRRCCS